MMLKNSKSLAKQKQSLLALSKTTEPCDRMLAHGSSNILNKSPSAQSRYQFVTTISNPAYVLAPVAKRQAEFTNLQAWKFFKEKQLKPTQRDHFTNRLRSIDNYVDQAGVNWSKCLF
jgi:hypothetical protein